MPARDSQLPRGGRQLQGPSVEEQIHDVSPYDGVSFGHRKGSSNKCYSTGKPCKHVKGKGQTQKAAYCVPPPT